MARKPRDYKKEYAQAKQKATAAGYKSQREYKRVRRELTLPTKASPIPKRILQNTSPEVISNIDRSNITRLRNESRKWSKAHSKSTRSKFRAGMTDAEIIAYHTSFVERASEDLSRRKRAARRRKHLHKWLVPQFMGQDEWDEKYAF